MRPRRPLVRLGLGVVGLVGSSTAASAHGFNHGSGAAAFALVLGLPTLAGLVGGIAAVRYRIHRRSETPNRCSSLAVGLLLVGLGAASFLPATTGKLWLSVGGGATGAAVALWLAVDGAPWSSCGDHAELTLGAVSTHRLLEGVVVGTLYSVGTAVGLFGAVVLAGHTALESAAVGGLYATASHRIWAVGAVVLVQSGYVAGAVVGLGVAGSIPVPVRTLAFAAVGGALLVAGASETGRSVVAGESVSLG